MEQIYTIPINEAFEHTAESGECPFCELNKKMTDNEIDVVLGGSAMDPDVRLKTNEIGFCQEHMKNMLSRSEKLPLALILQTRIQTVTEEITPKKLFAAQSTKKSVKKLSEKIDDCYLCNKIGNIMDHIYENAVYMWMADDVFKGKCSAQSHFCLPDYVKFVKIASEQMDSKNFSDFQASVSKKEYEYFQKKQEKIDWFIKKFDYRFSKDTEHDTTGAIEDVMGLLSGVDHDTL